MSVEWKRQWIEVCRSRVGHPEDNPRHERMHRTLRARTARPPCMTAQAQQRRFGDWPEFLAARVASNRGEDQIG